MPVTSKAEPSAVIVPAEVAGAVAPVDDGGELAGEGLGVGGGEAGDDAAVGRAGDEARLLVDWRQESGDVGEAAGRGRALAQRESSMVTVTGVTGFAVV